MKRVILLLVFGLFIFKSLLSQDISDAEMLANLDYMKDSHRIQCDSTSGSNLEHRICLNLEFQLLDSIMHVNYGSFLNEIENDSIKNDIIEFQYSWIKNRRNQCRLISNGLQGHSLGIHYLDCILKTTKRRVEEIQYLKEMY